MSTWNGASYIDEQLSSIFSQSFDGRVDILIRDDGSTDNTLELLEHYDQDRVTVIKGENLGAKASFFELMRQAVDIPADYYALADQDDVWLPEKIAQAVKRIDSSRPAMYSSSLTLVDHKLKFLSNYHHQGDRSFASSLMCNFNTGCSCVFNRLMLESIRVPDNLDDILMHDWWLASVSSGLGVVFYDSKSYILYRQHSSNLVGMTMGVRGLINRGKKTWVSQQGPSRLTQALALQEVYKELFPDSSLDALSSFIIASRTVLGRLYYAWQHRSHVSLLTIIRFILLA